MTDEEKASLCLELVEWGLMRRDEYGRFWVTSRGNVVGFFLVGQATYQETERMQRSKAAN